MPRRTLSLTVDERAELERTRDRDPRPYLREATAALRTIAAGQSPHAVARHGLHKPRKPETVERWLTTFEQHGLSGLVHRPRGHRGCSPAAGR
ncbi:helix-turn-helix domain-containing protein [Sphaerobacter thermophilus]|uniref:helix-turn-helix domain-containing protein n=1 Tax=Sphaerobacter thermophilus TaxID=2057 RepID=UPI0001A3C4EE|nr:helix-turn-helix domain-containing protein [Sphaerobacter thermophilus]